MPPAAQRTRAALAERAGLMNAEDLQRPTITVIRAKGSTSEKYNVAVDFRYSPEMSYRSGRCSRPHLNCRGTSPARKLLRTKRLRELETALLRREMLRFNPHRQSIEQTALVSRNGSRERPYVALRGACIQGRAPTTPVTHFQDLVRASCVEHTSKIGLLLLRA
jgi:hypothetical protein